MLQCVWESYECLDVTFLGGKAPQQGVVVRTNKLHVVPPWKRGLCMSGP